MPNLDVSFEDELKYAKEFYKSACEGLKESEFPPEPDDFLDDYEEYRSSWEFLKVQMLMEEDEEKVKVTKAFLGCTLCVYMDFMTSLSYIMERKLDEQDAAEGKIESYDFPQEVSTNESKSETKN